MSTITKATTNLWKDAAATHNYYEWTYNTQDANPLTSNKYIFYCLPQPQHHDGTWDVHREIQKFKAQDTLGTNTYKNTYMRPELQPITYMIRQLCSPLFIAVDSGLTPPSEHC